MTDHPSLGLPSTHGYSDSYSSDWMVRYYEQNYTDMDPVRNRIKSSRIPFFWDDMMKNTDLNKTEIKFMEEAREAGVKDGIGISMPGQLGEIAGIGLARNHDEKTKDYRALSDLQLLSIHYNEIIRSFIQPAQEIKITKREKEVLLWSSEGKTDYEISFILGISENTVRFHWKNIFKKLDAHGRVYATAKAIRLQLITPQSIQNTYQYR